MFSRSIRLPITPGISQLSTHIQTQQLRRMTTFKLNTGASIPAIGLGTWQGTNYLLDDVVVLNMSFELTVCRQG